MAGQLRATKLAHDAVHSDDRDKVRLSEGIRQTKDAINAVPFLGGGRLVSVRFAAANADIAIAHGLGVPAACVVVRPNYETNTPLAIAESDAAAQTTKAPDQTKLLALRASTAGTVDLWFYPRASKVISDEATQSP